MPSIINANDSHKHASANGWIKNILNLLYKKNNVEKETLKVNIFYRGTSYHIHIYGKKSIRIFLATKGRSI